VLPVSARVVLIFVSCLVRGLPLRFTLREHAWMALFGAFMFSVSYIFVYYAEQHVASGLVAVGYSASPLLGMVGLWVFIGTPTTLPVASGAVLGIVGIALVFLPAFVKPATIRCRARRLRFSR
jgi:drug/metabolite transporter (DMT)-like permease